MVQKYDIVLESQLGQRYGMLTWTETGIHVTGTLSLLGFDNPIIGQRDGQKLELTHKLRTVTSTLTCHTSMRLQGNELFGIISSERCRMDFHGKKSMEKEQKQA